MSQKEEKKLANEQNTQIKSKSSDEWIGKGLVLAAIIAFIAGISPVFRVFHKALYPEDLKKSYYEDCSDYFRNNFRNDGIYELSPDGVTRFNAYCNMTAGGWTVVFRRSASNERVNFQAQHLQYKLGFGDLHGNHWLGLQWMHLLTKQKHKQLVITLNDTSYRYNKFMLTDAFDHFKFIIDEELDTFLDESSLLRLNNTRFSTHDVDFDLAKNSNCSSAWKGGWWFTDCFDNSVCATCMIMHGNKGAKSLIYADMMLK